jgi:hypothetical protein
LLSARDAMRPILQEMEKSVVPVRVTRHIFRIRRCSDPLIILSYYIEKILTAVEIYICLYTI